MLPHVLPIPTAVLHETLFQQLLFVLFFPLVLFVDVLLLLIHELVFLFFRVPYRTNELFFVLPTVFFDHDVVDVLHDDATFLPFLPPSKVCQFCVNHDGHYGYCHVEDHLNDDCCCCCCCCCCCYDWCHCLVNQFWMFWMFSKYVMVMISIHRHLYWKQCHCCRRPPVAKKSIVNWVDFQLNLDCYVFFALLFLIFVLFVFFFPFHEHEHLSLFSKRRLLSQIRLTTRSYLYWKT